MGNERRLVAEAGRMLLQNGLVARTWGNVSCRTGKNSFVITPSGLSYDTMTEEDVVPYDMTTGEWIGSRKPSSEKGVHAAAYAQFPEVGFVIHTHQMFASAVGITGFGKQFLTDAEYAALGGVALAKYGLPGTKRLRENVATALAAGAHTVLMAQHGALVTGRTRDEAFERAMRLEAVCRRAVKGQSDGPQGDARRAEELKVQAGSVFRYVGYTTAPAVVNAAASTSSFRAQLDDMAQMIGPRLIAVRDDANAVTRALKSHPAVLVPGVGAICRAESKEDCDALCLLAHKACVSYLHTRALGVSGTLSRLDTWLMRLVYQMKYSKKSEAGHEKEAT